MNYFLAQIILAARNRDLDDWTNILFIVVVGLFWLVGGILKAKTSKTKAEEEEEKEQLPRKPARKPSEHPSRVQRQYPQQPGRPSGPAPRREYQPQVRQPPRKIVRPQPAAQKFAAETKEAVQFPTLEIEFKKPKIGIPAEIPRAKYLSEILLDYDDPDKLRKAILHYEILGKPLSLREPAGKIPY